jgi:hypothetical protein
LKRLVVLGILIAAAAGVLTLPALADESTVNATITPKLIALSVTPNTLDYGSHEPGETGLVPDPEYFAVINTGSVNEDLQIRGANTADWNIASTPGEDEYVHRFKTNSTFTALTTSNQSLFAGVAPLGEIDVFMNLDMPSDTTILSTQTAPITVVALESP